MRALVLSGGGGKGAWACGVLRHLLGDLQNRYDILAGVSSGAINCGFLAQFSHGQEKIAVEELTEWWLKIDNQHIFKRHYPFGRLHALFGRSSIYDSQPLIDLLTQNISLDKIRGSGKHISVGAVSLNSGKYTVFHQDHPDFINAIIASAAFPGIFKPIKIDGHLYADGGVKSISPLQEAIKLGATEVDVLITSPQTRIKGFIEDPNVLEILQRAIDLASDKILANDLEKAVLYNKLAERGDTDYRYVKINVFRPKYNLTDNMLDFDPEKIRDMMDKGYQEAKQTANNLT